MNNPILISTAAFDGYDLATAISEIAAIGADAVELAFIEGYTDPFTEEDYCHAISQMLHYQIKDVDRQGDSWGFTEIGQGMIDYQSIL